MIGLEPLKEELDGGVLEGESWLTNISDEFLKKEEVDTFSGKKIFQGCKNIPIFLTPDGPSLILPNKLLP